MHLGIEALEYLDQLDCYLQMKRFIDLAII